MEPLEDRAVPALDLSGLTVTPLVVAPGDVVAVGGTIADDRPMDYAGVTAYWDDGSSADSTLIPADPPVSSLSVDGYLSHSFSAVGTYTVTIQVDADIPPDGDSDTGSATFTVTVLPGVSVAVLNDAVEDGTDGVLRFTRTGGTGTALSATYSVSGSAAPGTDYTALSGSVAFAAGSSTADVPVHALKDTLEEDDETVIATVTGDGTTYTGVGGSATLDVIDTTLLPVALDFWNDTTENTPATVTPLGAVINLDSDALSLSAVGAASHGAVAVNADGSVTYTPATGYVGDDSFTYTVAYATGTTTATISYTVDGLLAPPFSVWTAPGTAVSIDAAGAAYDPTGGTPTVAAVGSASHGLVAINADGTIGYTPAAGFTGDDSFSYTAEDAAGNQRSNTITVTVSSSEPVALDADEATDQDTAVTVSVLNSAFNPAGGTLTVASVTQGAHGIAALNADGTVTYTPAAGYAGPDSFQYTVTDGNGNTATATVSVTVGPAASTSADDIEAALSDIEDDLANANSGSGSVDAVTSAISAVSPSVGAYLGSVTSYVSANEIDSNGELKQYQQFVEQTVPVYMAMYQKYNELKDLEARLYSLMSDNADLIWTLGGQLKTAKAAANPNATQIATLKISIVALEASQQQLKQLWDLTWSAGTRTEFELKEMKNALLGAPAGALRLAPLLPTPQTFPPREVDRIVPKIP